MSFAQEKPNVVVIFTDDQGYGDLGCFGSKKLSTPHIDQMASEGAKLTNFYVAAPVCTPSRAALMTGCYPKRVGMTAPSSIKIHNKPFRVFLAGDQHGLNPEELTIAEVAQQNGYKTGMFGKWHLGDQPEFLPTRQGFEEFFGLPYSHDIHPYHPRQSLFNFPPLPLLEGETVIEEDADADYFTKRFTEKAVDFIKRNKEKPFFLYLPNPNPHGPLQASPSFMESASEEFKAAIKQEKEEGTVNFKLRQQIYPQAISEIDWSVGEILKTLKEEGIDDNTIVLFTTDNGPAGVGSAGPLSGKKGSTLEGGMRVPTVIRWPARIEAGQTIDELMTTMDLLPTFAALIGADLSGGNKIDGKDITATLTEGKESPHEYFYYYSANQLEAVRKGDWKYRNTKHGGGLFNLSQDPGEKVNLAKAHPKLVSELKQAIEAFDQQLMTEARPRGVSKTAEPLSKKKN